jgi:hypothetical protein
MDLVQEEPVESVPTFMSLIQSSQEMSQVQHTDSPNEVVIEPSAEQPSALNELDETDTVSDRVSESSGSCELELELCLCSDAEQETEDASFTFDVSLLDHISDDDF